MTSDGWTSSTTGCYITVTSHIVNKPTLFSTFGT